MQFKKFRCFFAKLEFQNNLLRSYSQETRWYTCVGLEIHTKILSKSKIFSTSSADYQMLPNRCVACFDLGSPGTMPILNKKCVEQGIILSNALNCRINETSTFDRKHYFYPDLAAGYQITQHRIPLSQDGYLDYINFNPAYHRNATYRRVAIRQIHLEHDSGKSINLEGESGGVKNESSLVDYNRLGIGLLEIVTEPTLVDGEDCGSFLNELITVLTLSDINDGRLDRGSLRVDANVSVVPLWDYDQRFHSSLIHHKDQGSCDSTSDSPRLSPNQMGKVLQKLPRFEIKNLNSTRHLVQAVDYEISRLKKLCDTVFGSPGNVDDVATSGTTSAPKKEENLFRPETRGYDASKNQTYMMRYKDDADDYRYMPEPNLPNLILGPESSRFSLYPEPVTALYLSHPSAPHPVPISRSPGTLARYFNAVHGLSLENAFQLARDDSLHPLFSDVQDHFGSSSLNPHHLFSLLSTVIKSYFKERGLVASSFDIDTDSSDRDGEPNLDESTTTGNGDRLRTRLDTGMRRGLAELLSSALRFLSADTLTLASSKIVLNHFINELDKGNLKIDNIKEDMEKWIIDNRLIQVSDPDVIKIGVDKYIKEYPKLVRKCMKGKNKDRAQRTLALDISKHHNGVFNPLLLHTILETFKLDKFK